jgi:hypothetical protein
MWQAKDKVSIHIHYTVVRVDFSKIVALKGMIRKFVKCASGTY